MATGDGEMIGIVDIFHLAFSPEVISAWEEVIRRNKEKLLAEKSNENSIKELRCRLSPIREIFRYAAYRYISQISSYKDLKIYLSPFWERSKNGARLKSHIWNSAALSKDKTEGRLQLVLGPHKQVFTEYVAYRVTEPGRIFHIQRLSKRLQERKLLIKFQEGLQQLPHDFKISCTCANGTTIESYVHDISNIQWAALENLGLGINDTVARNELFLSVTGVVE